MNNIKTFLEFINENINIPVKVGDTILRGRFKNVKVKVKKIGKNKGQPIINGKNVLTFRMLTNKQQKEIKEKE
jgi:hypothetical protein